MRDIDVRKALAAKIEARFSDDPGTLIIHELGLRSGIARIDLAVVNGHLHGYEIKSESDTLARLPAQAEVYGSVLDLVTIVVGANHLESAMAIIPDWWGIIKAEPCNPLRLTEIRAPRVNLNPNALDVVRLLWRDEALAFLQEFGYDKGMRGKARECIYRRLAESLPLGDIQSRVRHQLKARANWRVDALRM
jgi:hypothetical protein